MTGQIILAAPKSLVLLMAQNFMGEPEENISGEHLSGTLTETANMIAGNALKKMDSKKPFELEIPEMIDGIKQMDPNSFTLIQTTDAVLAFGLILDSA